MIASDTEPAETKARLIAFYLPQFQPTPENDEWWGKGFTEWTNVAKAKPLYKGHRQPRVPADLGFYDLRLPQVRQAQADLAREHSIEGFCYWHYWFEGRRILDRVEKEVLRTGEPDFPFCLGWANHNWSRTWMGDTKTLLIGQTYSDADSLVHARYLAEFFADKRYIHVQGRPVFMVFQPFDIPDAERKIDLYREEITRLGLPNPMFLAGNMGTPFADAREIGFDSNIDMSPKWSLIDRSAGWKWRRFLRNGVRFGVWDGELQIYDFEKISNYMYETTYAFPNYPAVCIGWDNSPRRGKNGWIYINETPEKVGKNVRRTIESVAHLPKDERLVFVNAWNEWGEGMYLEPDTELGTSLLEEVRRANRVDRGSVV